MPTLQMLKTLQYSQDSDILFVLYMCILGQFVQGGVFGLQVLHAQSDRPVKRLNTKAHEGEREESVMLKTTLLM